MDKTIHVVGTPSEPVTKTPLEGIETEVLRVWLEHSPPTRRAHRANPRDVEQAVRNAVNAAHEHELLLRAQGLPLHEAREQAAPLMWTPPTVPQTPK